MKIKNFEAQEKIIEKTMHNKYASSPSEEAIQRHKTLMENLKNIENGKKLLNK